MKKYKFSFHGRQTGAIGISYDITQEYECESIEEAVTKLCIDYEPWRNLHLNGEKFQLKTEYFDHKPTLKTYKGLGMLRK